MSNTTTQTTPLTRFDFNDKMGYLASKFKFMNEAIVCWNDDAVDFNEDLKTGYGFIMDALIKELEESVERLEECS